MRWIWLCLTATWCLAAPVGLVNGSFELDADQDGRPDSWATSGDASVRQSLTRERLDDGTWCAKLECTAFGRPGPAAHAMLAQNDSLRLERGQWYRLRLRIKGDLPAGAVNVALSNTRTWSNLGLQDGILVEPTWSDFETTFRATESITSGLRLQLWWTTTGTVWFDDVQLESIPPAAPRGVEALPATDAANLVPNGGFEAGVGNWHSVADVPGWGGNLTGLVGEADHTEHRSGAASLRIALQRDRLPVFWFDYFKLQQVPILRPLAGHRGWIAVTPGQSYVASAWVKAAPADLPATLRVRGLGGWRREVTQPAGGDWTQVQLPFRPETTQVYVAVGPDLGERAAATLWVDDVALSAGDRSSDTPRSALVVLIEQAPVPQAPGPGPLRLQVANLSPAPRRAELRWRLTDFDDAVAATGEVAVDLAAGGSRAVAVGPVLPPGFYRATVEVAGGEVYPPQPARLLLGTANQRGSTICGMNHGYPSGGLLAASRRIGLGWFRDWSYKWHDVEPAPGRFDFAAADAQVDRVRAADLQVMCNLPFPSALWASRGAAPANQSDERAMLACIAHAPRDPALLANYIRSTVAHLRGRVGAFEIFNEPVYTHYSLPRAAGYTVEDYGRLLQLAAGAVRAGNPEALVLGGIQAGPAHLTRELIATGALRAVDALTLHTYPGRARPETLVPDLEQLRADLAAAGLARLPLWWTEGSYYADDDPGVQPYTSSWLTALPTERLAAQFTVRLNAILCGYDTRRIIYHSGTTGQLNEDNPSGVFFEYDGQPRKVAAAVLAFNHFVGPDFVTRGRLPSAADVYGFAFDSDGRSVAVVWTTGPPRPLVPNRERWATYRERWEVYDLQGRPVSAAPQLGPAPLYLVAGRPGQSPALP